MVDGSDKPQHAVTRRALLNWLLVFCVVAIIVLAVATGVSRRPPEPVYSGVGLSQWLGEGVSNVHRMVEVINSVGPEALPWLVSALPGLEFEQRYETWLQRLSQKNPVANRLLLKFTNPRRHAAYFRACWLLGRLAPGTSFETKALRAFMPRRPEDDSELIKIRLWALGRCTNSPDKAIPILISELTNSATVDKAVDSLGNFGSLATHDSTRSPYGKRE